MTNIFFKDDLSVFVFLVFVVFYVPCIATLASFSSEFGRIWAVISFMLSLAIGYCLALSLYLMPMLLAMLMIFVIMSLVAYRKFMGNGDASFST